MPDSSQPKPENGPSRRVGIYRFSMLQFLIALVLLLVTVPLVEELSNWESIETVLLTLVLVSAVLAIGARHRTLVLALVLVTPAVVGKWLNRFRPDLVPQEIFLGSGLVFLVFVVAQLLIFILRAPRVTADVLCAGLATYLLLGLLWSLAYALVANLVPNSFSLNGAPMVNPPLQGSNSLYFSFITLSTVGYGDITPVSNAARMLAAAEAVTGTLFMAVLIARLVSLYTTESAPKG